MGRLRNGVGVGISNIPTLSSRRQFSPLSLFAGGTQGVWFDDSNISTMFQDSAGTTPVTAVEQPVGRQLDLSGNNNHRTQATDANRPTLSARYNLLLATATLSTQNITTVATSYTITFTGAGTVTLSGTYVGVFSAGTNTFTATAGTLTVTVVGSVLTADIRPTNQTVTLPLYQAVTSSTVYDTVGFPQYLKYNGSNSWLSTASINFTATAQVSLFGGVRKMAAGTSIVVELSTNVDNNGNAFNFASDAVSSNNWYFSCASTAQGQISARATTFTAPITNTISSIYDRTVIGSSQITPKINNATPTIAYTGVGSTSNFGTYPLYFGRRGGTTLSFNGQEYQIIIVGKTLTATEIASTETYVNSKTRAY